MYCHVCAIYLISLFLFNINIIEESTSVACYTKKKYLSLKKTKLFVKPCFIFFFFFFVNPLWFCKPALWLCKEFSDLQALKVHDICTVYVANA